MNPNTLLTTTLALLCLAAPARATLANFDFSDGLNGWETFGDVELLAGESLNGNAAIKVASTDSVAWAMITFKPTAITSMRYSFNILTDLDGGGLLELGLFSLSGDLIWGSSQPISPSIGKYLIDGSEYGYKHQRGWARSSARFTSTEPVRFGIAITNGANDPIGRNAIMVGDIEVVPDGGSTAALLASALVLCVLMRRRHAPMVRARSDAVA